MTYFELYELAKQVVIFSGFFVIVGFGYGSIIYFMSEMIYTLWKAAKAFIKVKKETRKHRAETKENE